MDKAHTKECAEIIHLSNIESQSADVNKQLMGHICKAQSFYPHRNSYAPLDLHSYIL